MPRPALRLLALCALAGCAAPAAPPGALEPPPRVDDDTRALPFEQKALALERTADRDVALARRDLAAPVYARLVEVRSSGDLPAVSEARNLAELAVTEHERGQLFSAEQLYRRSLALLDEPGADDPDLRALVSLSLGILVRAGGHPADAAPLLERAAELRAVAGGPELAIALGESAAARAALGQNAEAGERYRRALAIWERTPDSDLLAAQTLANLALLHRARGENDRARALLERALPLYEKKLPPDDPTLQRVRALLAESPAPQTAPAPPPNAADTARELDRQGAALLDRRDYARARPLLERAVALHERGETAPVELGASLSYLGRVYAGLGERAAARAALERSLALLEPALGKLDPLTLATRASLENLH